MTDKIRKYVLPNIPYLFIGWFCLKIGTAYRLAAGAGFGEKLLGLGQTIGAAFASFAPGLAPLDWFVGIVGAVGFRLLIYCKAKKAKKFRRDAEYGTARWGTEKDIKPFVDPKFENNIILTGTVQSTTMPEDILLNGNYNVGNLISLNHRELIFTFLQKGYVDAIGAHEESIIQYMKDYDASFRILEEPLMKVGVGVAFSKNDKRDLCEKLDKTLKEMRKDGTSKKIIGKYLSNPEKYLEVDDFAY